jgi:DNA polymerase III epsilon subunit-like protein
VARPSLASTAWCSRGLGGAPLRETARPWVVIDTETEGLDPERHRLIELAAIVVSADLVEERVVRWTRKDGPAALAAACRELAPFVAAGVVVAHHLRFDLEFLQRLDVGVAGALAAPPRWLCTLHANGTRRSLDGLADAFDVPIVGRHTAIGDARALSVVLSRAIAEADEHGMSTVAGIVVRMALREGRTAPTERASATGWAAVLADLDHVVPLAMVTAEHRTAVRSALESVGDRGTGPNDPATCRRVTEDLREARVSALACVWILQEHGVQVGGSHGGLPTA